VIDAPGAPEWISAMIWPTTSAVHVGWPC
jgi:hypothetical protein